MPRQQTYLIVERSSRSVIGRHTTSSFGPEELDLRAAAASLQRILPILGFHPDLHGVLEVPDETPQIALSVDLASGTLHARPHLDVRIDPSEIEGDGRSVANIVVRVLDATPLLEPGARPPELRVDETWSGTLHVTTTRGRLSVRGGMVAVERGQATLTLRSVDESVDVVTVQVSDPADVAVRGEATLRFV